MRRAVRRALGSASASSGSSCSASAILHKRRSVPPLSHPRDYEMTMHSVHMLPIDAVGYVYVVFCTTPADRGASAMPPRRNPTMRAPGTDNCTAQQSQPADHDGEGRVGSWGVQGCGRACCARKAGGRKAPAPARPARTPPTPCGPCAAPRPRRSTRGCGAHIPPAPAHIAPRRLHPRGTGGRMRRSVCIERVLLLVFTLALHPLRQC